MLKIVHLLTGAAALLLSFAPSLQSNALPYLQQPEVIYLTLFGLINLSFSKSQNNPLPQHFLASVLLVTATAVQGATLLMPMQQIAGQPALLISLIGAALAVVLLLLPKLNFSLPAAKEKPAQSYVEGNREAGTVKWFNTSKGFGFISRDSGDDIFVHFRAIRGEGHRVLVEGQRVEFSVAERDKGLQAEDVVGLPTRR